MACSLNALLFNFHLVSIITKTELSKIKYLTFLVLIFLWVLEIKPITNSTVEFEHQNQTLLDIHASCVLKM